MLHKVFHYVQQDRGLSRWVEAIPCTNHGGRNSWIRTEWMDKQEFMDIMVSGSATPGIFAIDMASHIRL